MRRGNVDLRRQKKCGVEPDTAYRSNHEVEHRHGEPARSAAGRFGRQFKMQRVQIKRRRSENNADGDGFGVVQLTKKRATIPRAMLTQRGRRHMGLDVWRETLWRGRCRTHVRMWAGEALHLIPPPNLNLDEQVPLSTAALVRITETEREMHRHMEHQHSKHAEQTENGSIDPLSPLTVCVSRSTACKQISATRPPPVLWPDCWQYVVTLPPLCVFQFLFF